MKLRTTIFIVIFFIGVLPLLALVSINLRGHFERHKQVEFRRLLAQASLTQKTVIQKLKESSNHFTAVRDLYPDFIWIDSQGIILHMPASLKAENKTALKQSPLWTTFPDLKNNLSSSQPLLAEGLGSLFSWIPLPESPTESNRYWIGTEIDSSAAQEWKKSLVQNIVVILLTTMLVVFVIAQYIATKIDTKRKELLHGLQTLLNTNEPVLLSWHGPKEIRELGRDISATFQQFRHNQESRQRYQTELIESENKFRRLADSAQDAIILMDSEGQTAFWNTAAETIFGYTKEEALGQFIHNLLHLRRHDQEEIATDLPASVKETLELIARRKDSIDICIELSLAAAQINKQWHAIWIARDISERKRLEKEGQVRQQQLVQADKMHSLGLLVAGIAHEINNPNSITILNANLLAQAWQDICPILEEYYQENGDFILAGLDYSEMRDQVVRLFDELEESGKRIKNIVKDLKDYARKETESIQEDVDLNKAVEKAIRLTHNQLKKCTDHFHFEAEPHLPRLKGNRQRFEQIAINLIQNSCEALRHRHEAITIRIKHNPEDNLVELCINDQGKGIDPKDIKKIIDPFFTTKRNFGGTGLGLSVTAGIIKRYNGTLNFESEPGRGTTARVCFPVPNTAT